jgi:hypothetical protein
MSRGHWNEALNRTLTQLNVDRAVKRYPGKISYDKFDHRGGGKYRGYVHQMQEAIKP